MNTDPHVRPEVAGDALDGLIAIHRDQSGGLLPLLHAVQGVWGHVPAETVGPIAKALNLSRAEVHGVVTYYHHFRSEKPGRHVVEVCRAESCKAVGADALMAHAERVLGCQSHQTRDDAAVTLLPVYCLGMCAMSPAIAIDDKPYARMTFDKLERLAARLEIAA